MQYDPEHIKYLIGLDYDDVDCWGIVLLFYKKVFNKILKAYYDERPVTHEETKTLVFSYMGDFIKTNNPKYGDIILFNVWGLPCHIGIYLDDRNFLHTSKTTNCVIDNLPRWHKSVVAFYTVKQ